MRVMVIPIVIGSLGTIPKGLKRGVEELDIGRSVKPIQITVLLSSVRIPRRVWRLVETCCHADSTEKPSANAGGKNSQKRSCRIVDFAVPADHRVKLKDSEKKDKYLDLAWELKKLRNMEVKIIPIVIGGLSTVTKGLVQGLEDLEIIGRVETIQTIALLRILRRVLETWRNLLSLKLQWKKHRLTLMRKTQKGVLIIIIIIIIIIIWQNL